jgi:hypothetical protein
MEASGLFPCVRHGLLSARLSFFVVFKQERALSSSVSLTAHTFHFPGPSPNARGPVAVSQRMSAQGSRESSPILYYPYVRRSCLQRGHVYVRHSARHHDPGVPSLLYVTTTTRCHQCRATMHMRSTNHRCVSPKVLPGGHVNILSSLYQGLIIV